MAYRTRIFIPLFFSLLGVTLLAACINSNLIGIMESENKSKGEIGVTRHCAYCLNICGLPTKLCGGCTQRAYCSKECQRADWSVKGNGQRHVNWCRRHECGEEDVDWEVVPIPNKGLGIRAKKLIPSGFKILVEPVFLSPNDHPGIKDLEPERGSLNQKFTRNFFMGENFEQDQTVALRIARVNHACQPNAAAVYDETALVAVLVSLKDIQPGEEISISYYAPFFVLHSRISMPGMGRDPSIVQELNYVKKSLLYEAFGITCPTDCPCFDPTIPALVKEGRQIYQTAIDLSKEYKIEEALIAGEKLLDVHRRLNVSCVDRGFTDFRLFQIAVQKSETLPRAMKYLRSAAELFGKICPYSERLTKKLEKLLKHPELDKNYLVVDKMQNVSDSMGRFDINM